MHKSLFTTAAAALFGVLAVARPEGSRLKSRDIIKAIPEGASPRELKFKPWTDYDTDSCYNTAAVSEDGTANPGTGPTTTFQGNCRDPHQLENSNIYSRMRCNHGICAFMYDYYFEKDQASHGTFASGHPHDWENIVVFTAGEGADEHVIFTAASCHHGYGGGDALLGGGTHPLVVYNKDGTQTHCFRLASPDDVAQAENHTGGFVNTPLLGWGRLRDEVPKAYEAIANSDNWGGTSAKIQDSEFAVWLNKAREAGGDLLFDFNASIG